MHGLITYTDRTLDVVFLRFRGFFVHNNPEAVTQRSYAYALSLFCNSTLTAWNSFGLLPQGYCEQKTLKS